VILWLACATGGPTDSDPAAPSWATAEPAPVVPLSDDLLLRRLSLDLRGQLPSVGELERLRADPEELDVLLAEFLLDPRHEERMADMFAQRWLTRTETYPIKYFEFGYEDDEAHAWRRSVAGEPARLVAYVAARDKPWDEIVTADYTIANDLLLESWPMAELEGREQPSNPEWRVAQYTDGRPRGGVLMSTGLWWRYYQAIGNRSRGEAAARLLACTNFLERPIVFDSPSTLDQDALEDAVRQDPACQSCHSGLDPISSALFGFSAADVNSPHEMSTYHPERERQGVTDNGSEPGWFGEPIYAVGELGPVVAADPRFASCAVESFTEELLRRETELDDFPLLQDLEGSFEQGDRRASALITAIVATDEYRAGGLLPEATAEHEKRIATRRLMSPDQLADSIEQLTGYRWTSFGYDQLTNDVYGYRTLTGGVNPTVVDTPQVGRDLTQGLVNRRLAQAAATYAVEGDLAGAGPGLLVHVDEVKTPADAAFDQELDQLSDRLHARALDDLSREVLTELWWATAEAGDPVDAWAAVVAVQLRDPAFWSY